MRRAVISLAGLLAVGSASAHAGHSNRAAWDACTGRASGAPCAWTDADHRRAIGTCHQFGGAMLCVRRLPLAPPATPVAR